MAVFMMVDKDKAGQPNVVGPKSYDGHDLYIEETYTGCVLETRERNYHDDSDFYAVVWDEETQGIKHIEYATTRFWSGPNHAIADATPEVREKVCDYYRAIYLGKWRDQQEALAMTPDIGKHVHIVYGTGKGKHGIVFGIRSKGKTQRVGFTDQVGFVRWTDINNIKVVDWDRFVDYKEEEGVAWATYHARQLAYNGLPDRILG